MMLRLMHNMLRMHPSTEQYTTKFIFKWRSKPSSGRTPLNPLKMEYAS